jgi:hypothetical protein
MDKASKRYLTASVIVLVAAILFSLAAIIVRGVAAAVAADLTVGGVTPEIWFATVATVKRVRPV